MTTTTLSPSPFALGKTGLAALYELTKPRITRLVAITSGVGFALSAVGHNWRPGDLALRASVCLAGTALSASGANALNQWWERDRDALMPRTCARPLPQSRVSPSIAFAGGMAFSMLGITLLALLGPAPALISAATILIYILLYTPLKPVTTFNTLVGAVPGALPPLIGWTAAATGNHPDAPGTIAGLLQPGGWSLFILMVIWQVPHVLALAWMYRDDYAKGGYRMLPVIDPTGRATARTILVWAGALIPATVAPAVLLHDRLSPVYGLIAAATGFAFLSICFRLARTRARADARRVFLGSIIHLPVLLLAMVADTLIVAWIGGRL